MTTSDTKIKRNSNPVKRNKKSLTPVKKRNDTLLAIIFFIISFLLYANTLNHGYALDDDIYTRKNNLVQQGVSALPGIFFKGSLYGFNKSNDTNYRPFTLFNFWLETRLFGNSTRVNHFFNVLFFSLTSFVLFLLLKKLFSQYNILIPTVITAFFILHPVHTEVVANIKSRDEILGFLFGLLSFYAVILYYETKRYKFLIFSVGFFFFSTLSKESGLTFMLLIPLLLYFFTSASYKQIIQIGLPFVAVAILYLFIRNSVLDSITFNEKIPVMNNALMAATNKADMYATNLVFWGKYLGLLFFPHPLSWDYSYNQIPIVSWGNIKVISSALVYSCLAAYVVVRFRKKDPVVFGILTFVITLLLASNLIVKIQATFAERFLYVPSLGFCIAITFVLLALFKIDIHAYRLKHTTPLYTFLAVVFSLYAFKLVDRNKDWKNNSTLFKTGIKTSPNSARAHFAIANEYRKEAEMSADPEARKQLFIRAIESYNKGSEIYPNDPDIWYNKGVSYYSLGNNEAAKQAYEKTIALRPNYIDALNNLGVIYFNMKAYDEANTCFEKIIKIDPLYYKAYANMAAVSDNKGDLEKTISYSEKVIAIEPNELSIYANLYRLYLAKGDTVKANIYKARGEKRTRQAVN